MSSVKHLTLLITINLIAVCVGGPVTLTIRNVAGDPINVFWMNGEQLVNQSPHPVLNSSQTVINSFTTHKFAIIPSNGAKGRRAELVAGDDDEFFTLNEDFSLTSHSIQNTAYERARMSLEECELSLCSGADMTCTHADSEGIVNCVSESLRRWLTTMSNEATIECTLLERAVNLTGKPLSLDERNDHRICANPTSTVHAGEAAIKGCTPEVECIANALVGPARSLSKAVASIRTAVRERREEHRNKLCEIDEPFSMAVPVNTQPHDWIYSSEYTETNRTMRIQDLFWHPEAIPGARISFVDNFVSEEECRLIVDSARPRLAPATHAGEDGDLHTHSKARDSQQAIVPARKGSKSDPVEDIQRRTVALSNHLSGYDLELAGQENLMAIQYNVGQQYLLHCDGPCDGSPFVEGARLATVLVFCQSAVKGGATAFPNAGVHVVGRPGQAVYFHFRDGDSQTGEMENWHTEHSGCPVIEGEKWVFTEWLRDGVSARRNSYFFSPFGGPMPK